MGSKHKSLLLAPEVWQLCLGMCLPARQLSVSPPGERITNRQAAPSLWVLADIFQNEPSEPIPFRKATDRRDCQRCDMSFQAETGTLGNVFIKNLTSLLFLQTLLTKWVVILTNAVFDLRNVSTLGVCVTHPLPKDQYIRYTIVHG